MNVSAVCLSIILIAALFSQASPAPSEYSISLCFLGVDFCSVSHFEAELEKVSCKGWKPCE